MNDFSGYVDSSQTTNRENNVVQKALSDVNSVYSNPQTNGDVIMESKITRRPSIVNRSLNVLQEQNQERQALEMTFLNSGLSMMASSTVNHT